MLLTSDDLDSQDCIYTPKTPHNHYLYITYIEGYAGLQLKHTEKSVF